MIIQMRNRILWSAPGRKTDRSRYLYPFQQLKRQLGPFLPRLILLKLEVGKMSYFTWILENVRQGTEYYKLEPMEWKDNIEKTYETIINDIQWNVKHALHFKK